VTERLAGLVLAGGRSSRFGRDKLAEPIGGRPLLDHAIDALRTMGVEITVVTAPDGGRALPSDVRLVHDPRPFEGPLAGVAAGLGSLDPAVDRVIVVAGDMPTLVPAVLARLAAALDCPDAAVLADDDGPRPLPMAVRKTVAAAAAVRLLDRGERRLRALLAELDVVVIPPSAWRVDDPDAATLRDVDAPADLPLNG